jgi:ring-1,2-phenylacetyl-CoA epoxidase subunit PaaD
MTTDEIKTQKSKIKTILEGISDPEIPVLSIMDMGIVRDIEINEKNVLIKITPTYSGCPAMDTIAMEIKIKLEQAGYNTTVKNILSPAWTTDWITEKGRKDLEKYGIAAPLNATLDKRALLDGERIVKCPQCNSTNTKMVSQFGSTACKALFQCEDCKEPFDYFKCLK